MKTSEWKLLFHDCLIAQLERLASAAERAWKSSPDNAVNNANVKLFRAVSVLIFKTIPQNPGDAKFRQGNTLSSSYRHWRRAKIGRRFRLFFRYDSASHIIVYAWINDENTLRSSGSDTDPYSVFRKMLQRGTPPDDWDMLVAHSQDSPNI